jgi:hypothetical protein
MDSETVWFLNQAIYWLDRLVFYADQQSQPNAEPLDVVNAWCAFDQACDSLFNFQLGGAA